MSDDFRMLKSTSLIFALTVLGLSLALQLVACLGPEGGNQTGADVGVVGLGQPRDEMARKEFRGPKMLKFEEFARTFHKHYANFLEEASRRSLYLGRVFLSFMSTIGYRHNKTSSYLAVNHMSDWTDKEYEATLIGRDELKRQLVDKASHQQPPPLEWTPMRSLNESSLDTTINGYYLDERGELRLVRMEASQANSNTRVKRDIFGLFKWGHHRNNNNNNSNNQVFRDYRSGNCLQPVKSQGLCGSCYIFATMALYEWMHCQSSGERVALSEQFVLDCGKPVGVKGCWGGFVSSVATFVAQYGVEWANSYPAYEARVRSCPIEVEAAANEAATSHHQLGVGRFAEARIVRVRRQDFDQLLDRGPIVVGMSVPYLFMLYGGGVDKARHCLKKGSLFSHSMLLVGDGRQDGIDYYLLRNSHSKYWGEKGYYKVAKSSNCFFNYGQVPMDYFRLAGDLYQFIENPSYNSKLIEELRSHRSGGNVFSRIYNKLSSS